MPTAEDALTGHIEIGSPEDWRIDWARYGGPFICLPANHGGYWIAAVHGTGAELHKRAYLLAAAPRLLAALKAMLETHGRPHREEWLNDAAFEHAKKVDSNARLAISEAEKRTALTSTE
jgi:hypothetical protein